MSKKKCVDCQFFVFVDRWKNTIDELDDIGRCHRYPPSVQQDNDADHPLTCTHIFVVGDDWCGEFKPKSLAE